jgi:nucleolar protein 14
MDFLFQLKESHHKLPTVNDQLIFRLFLSTYSATDYKHGILGPVLTFIARSLSQIPIRTFSNLVEMTGLAYLAFEFTMATGKYLPELLGSLLRLLNILFDLSSAKIGFITHPLDECMLMEEQSVPITFSMRKMAFDNSCPPLEIKSGIISLILFIFKRLQISYQNLDAFDVIFKPIVHGLKSIPKELLCDEHEKDRCTLVASIERAFELSKKKRVPLQLQKKKPVAIPTYIPKFEESLYIADRGSKDPDRERAAEKSLKRKYKKEMKGAVRELRKDTEFVARKKLKDIKRGDLEYKKKIATIMGDLGNQEGDARRLEKAKRQ